MNEIVIVVTGAAPLHPRAIACIPDRAIVIAADGALDHALAAGIRPAALVGDLDSISPEGAAWAEANATIQRHPPDKVHTDTELALATAVDLNPARLVLVSGGGDRLDHTFAAIGALGHPSLTSIPTIDGWWGAQQVTVIHGPGRGRLRPPRGTTISALALHGPCRGVSITGVRWPLVDADVAPMIGLGISNETTDDEVEFALASGVLTVFINDVFINDVFINDESVDDPTRPSTRPLHQPPTNPPEAT
jgi:thiamine pyrophosphokinase